MENYPALAEPFVKSSGPVEIGVLKNVNGIGISGYSSAKKRDLKLLQLDGKAPNYENIKNGSYALYRPLYLVIKRNNKAPLVRDFIKYAVSREGQDIIRAQGTVPYAEAVHLVMKQKAYTTARCISSHCGNKKSHCFI